MSAAIASQFESCRPEGRLPSARNGGRKGRLVDRPGGLGGAANQVEKPAGGTTCLACLPSHFAFSVFSFLSHSGFHLVSIFRSFLHHSRFSSLSALRFVPVFLIFCFVSSSCVSSHHSDAQMLRVLEAEAKLLEDLKIERRHPTLLKKLHTDDSVSQAEEHLRDAIDALMKANAELRSTVKSH